MAVVDALTQEEKLKQRYLKLSKIFLLITLIYVLWIAIVIIGVYNLKYDPRWAVFTIADWILSAIVLISILLALELLFILQTLLLKRKKEQPAPRPHLEYVQGKQVYHYTLPNGAKGGIFSKTYVLIDDDRVLHLRYQMIQPQDLWRKQQ
jgi:hypothetical protein